LRPAKTHSIIAQAKAENSAKAKTTRSGSKPGRESFAFWIFTSKSFALPILRRKMPWHDDSKN
jgi:hypothetical protein